MVQDVLTRLDRAFQAFFHRRVKAGETRVYPRFHGANRYNSCSTYGQCANGATLDNGFLVLSRIGRIAVHWSCSLAETPKTVTLSWEADGWYACLVCEGVPIQPLPRTRQETGIDLGMGSFATLADGSQIANPRLLLRAERRLQRAQRRVSVGCRAAIAGARRWAADTRAAKGVPGAGSLPSEGGALLGPAPRHYPLTRICRRPPCVETTVL